ncbi:MAG: TRAP transporter small permease [Chloroflexi bacterium]|nr:TRAP transporter small permease [Chloroflexota bacterium]
MRLLARAGAIFDRALELPVLVAGFMLSFMLILLVVDVTLRKFFNSPIKWQLEVNEILLLFISLLPAAWLLKGDRHVKMDMLTRRVKPEIEALLGILNSVVGAAVFGVLFWYGIQVTLDHWQRGMFQPSTLQIPNAAVLWIIPVVSLLMFVQFLRRICAYLVMWRAREK